MPAFLPHQKKSQFLLLMVVREEDWGKIYIEIEGVKL
jgi:hypothetical protein